MVICTDTDFGRQISANLDNGTDHGRANYCLLIGKGVNGGTYGEMHPEREILPDPDDWQSPQRAPFEIPGADIKGRTSMEYVFGSACEWVAPAAGAAVFPNMNVAAAEAEVDLTGVLV